MPAEVIVNRAIREQLWKQAKQRSQQTTSKGWVKVIDKERTDPEIKFAGDVAEFAFHIWAGLSYDFDKKPDAPDFLWNGKIGEVKDVMEGKPRLLKIPKWQWDGPHKDVYVLVVTAPGGFCTVVGWITGGRLSRDGQLQTFKKYPDRPMWTISADKLDDIETLKQYVLT